MKTIIIGLDGATFDIINPLASAGRLPNLSRLMRDGVSSPLRSTILPNSFPGWASCTTGTSEGMHGVFSPFIKNPSSYTVRAMSGRDIMTRNIWDILSSYGGRSIVLNVPTTYPPEPINGMMVTGMLTPSMASDFTYPAALRAELLSAVPGYLIEPERIPNRHARAAEFRRATTVREQALDFLLTTGGEWDFLMVVFAVLDRAQHDYWADMDPAHPRHDPRTPREFREFIHKTYEQLDDAVGRLIERLPADSRVFVVSDHGFCSELFEVRVNEVLAGAGLLAFKTGRQTRARVRSLGEKISRRLAPAPRSNGSILEKKVAYGGAYLEEIDWSRTRAFFAQDKGVWVNLASREREAIVPESALDSVIDEARDALLSLMSPEDGEPVFEKVMSRQEAFNGRYSYRLPDLVMIPRRDEYVYNERPGYGEKIVPADSTTGTHSRDGILIASGKGIKAGARFSSQPNLKDVGPTVLASLACPLTIDMDGRALMEVFSDVSEFGRAGSSYRESDKATPEKGSVYSASEEAELRERMRALGYIE